MLEVDVVSLASEFPNDNPALHRGVIWVCRETTGRAEPERVLAPELMAYVHEPPHAAPVDPPTPEPLIERALVEAVADTPRAIAPVVTACALLMAADFVAIEANASSDAPAIETIESIDVEAAPAIDTIDAIASIEAEGVPAETLIVEELEPLDEHVAVSVEGAVPSLPDAAPVDDEIFVDDIATPLVAIEVCAESSGPIEIAPSVHHADAHESVSVPAASDDGAGPWGEPVLVAASIDAVETHEEHDVEEPEEERAPAAAVSEIVLVAANENAKESLDAVEEQQPDAEPQLASERIAVEILGGSAVLAAAVTPVFEEEIVAAPVPVDSTVLPAATDAFTILVCTLADVALAAGSPHIAALLPGLLFDGRVSGELDGAALEALRANGVLAGAEIAPDVAAVAGAWREILRGTSDDFSACGAAMLDEWSSDLLARLLNAPAKADAFRQELRSRGVAAFGLAA